MCDADPSLGFAFHQERLRLWIWLRSRLHAIWIWNEEIFRYIWFRIVPVGDADSVELLAVNQEFWLANFRLFRLLLNWFDFFDWLAKSKFDLRLHSISIQIVGMFSTFAYKFRVVAVLLRTKRILIKIPQILSYAQVGWKWRLATHIISWNAHTTRRQIRSKILVDWIDGTWVMMRGIAPHTAWAWSILEYDYARESTAVTSDFCEN